MNSQLPNRIKSHQRALIMIHVVSKDQAKCPSINEYNANCPRVKQYHTLIHSISCTCNFIILLSYHWIRHYMWFACLLVAYESTCARPHVRVHTYGSTRTGPHVRVHIYGSTLMGSQFRTHRMSVDVPNVLTWKGTTNTFHTVVLYKVTH